MLNEKESLECNRCYEMEKSNVWTLRKMVNQTYDKHWDRVETTQDDGTVEEVNMGYMDIRVSNICNFRCRNGSQTSSILIDLTYVEDFAPQAAPNLTINDSSSRTIRKTAFLVAVLGSLPSSRALSKSKLCVTVTVPSHLVDHQFGNQTDS